MSNPVTTSPHHPTTSQPSPGDFRRQFQFLASHFADVLSINLTGAVSGTLESARSAGLGIDETISAVEALASETHTYALLGDLRYSVRGGRIPSWVKTVADLFRITPLIWKTADGRIVTRGFFLGRRNRIRKFAARIAHYVSQYETVNVAIGHAVCLDDANELERRLRQDIPRISKLSVMNLGAGLGSHGGPGTLLVSLHPHTQPGKN